MYSAYLVSQTCNSTVGKLKLISQVPLVSLLDNLTFILTMVSADKGNWSSRNNILIFLSNPLVRTARRLFAC